MAKSELHLFILWENALPQKQCILDDINNHFSVVQNYLITWTPELVSSNYSRFYGTKLPSNSEKERVCGSGPFMLIIVKDEAPVYDYRKTSSGQEYVNVNMFDAKTRYRLWTNAGHRVHGTNNEIETNHDLTLLLGINMFDFLDGKRPDSNDVNLHFDIIGAKSWHSFRELFYVLNSTISYCVLRNYENLPDGFDNSIHGDIDLLVDNYKNAQLILNSHACFEPECRVGNIARVGNIDVSFDLRFVGDNYYDSRWEKSILFSSEINKNGVKCMSPENQYYSLLYHAFIHKKYIAKDYPDKLSTLGSAIGIKYINDATCTVSQLDTFMTKNRYEYIKPIDESVTYNIHNLRLSSYAFRYGSFVKRLEIDELNCSSSVYQRASSYVKMGTDWLINNEKRFLKLLDGECNSPKVLAEGQNEEGRWIEISNIEGISVSLFFKNKNNNNPIYVREYVLEVINLLKVLHSHHIIHRDFTPENQLIRIVNGHVELGLIDFGWAVYEFELRDCPNPLSLGGRYAMEAGYSDIYSASVFFNEKWACLPYVRRVIECMNQADCFDSHLLEKVSQRKLTVFDRCALFFLRHHKLLKIKNRVKSFFLLPVIEFRKYVKAIFRKNS